MRGITNSGEIGHLRIMLGCLAVDDVSDLLVIDFNIPLL